MKKDASLIVHTVNDRHILYYTVSKHRNTAYEESELYEYGIKCALCDLRGRLINSEQVHCISSNFTLVHQLTRVLAKHQVYPVHLMEILDDLLVRDSLPDDDNNSAPLLCV